MQNCLYHSFRSQAWVGVGRSHKALPLPRISLWPNRRLLLELGRARSVNNISAMRAAPLGPSQGVAMSTCRSPRFKTVPKSNKSKWTCGIRAVLNYGERGRLDRRLITQTQRWIWLLPMQSGEHSRCSFAIRGPRRTIRPAPGKSITPLQTGSSDGHKRTLGFPRSRWG